MAENYGSVLPPLARLCVGCSLSILGLSTIFISSIFRLRVVSVGNTRNRLRYRALHSRPPVLLLKNESNFSSESILSLRFKGKYYLLRCI
ncbi:unnamed protein product [Amoebophrya sp. A25]|nr:unnamed protein product [Amoebophrya sp. A25]|eukprot:GSA25T00003393001.1